MPTASVCSRFGLVLAVLAGFACGEPQCPDGFDKIGKVCRRHEGGVDAVLAGDADGEQEDDASRPAITQGVRDAATADLDARTSGMGQEVRDAAAAELDAGKQPAVADDARTPDRDATQAATPETGS